MGHTRTAFVAHLVERSPSMPEIPGSNPLTVHFQLQIVDCMEKTKIRHTRNHLNFDR